MVDINSLNYTDGYDEAEQKKVRGIKLHRQTFDKSLNFWQKHKLARTMDKLNDLHENILTSNYTTDEAGKLDDKSKKQMLKKAAAVARMEREIKMLYGEKVPVNYVTNRALKLKRNMEDSLRFNSENAYSIGLDRYDAVFGSGEAEKVTVDSQGEFVSEQDGNEVATEKTVESPKTGSGEDSSENYLNSVISENEERLARDVQQFLNEKELNVVPTEVDRQQIKDAVEDGFSSLISEAMASTDSTVGEEIESKVSQLNQLATDSEDIFGGMDEEIAALKGRDSSVIGKDAVKSSVDAAMAGVAISDDQSETTKELDYEDIKRELDKAIDSIKVSKTGTAAKLDKFDENGQFKGNSEEQEVTLEEIKSVIDEAMTDGKDEKKYDYQPMSDEEIARARANIEYDKYEEIYHNVKATKEQEPLPFVVPQVKFDDVFKPIDKVDNYGLVESPTLNFEQGENTMEAAPGRELPVIVPERSAEVTYTDDKRDTYSSGDNLHFDYSEATPLDVNNGFSRATSLEEFAELRKRAVEWKEKQRRSKEERARAEQTAVEAAERAKAVKEATEAKRRDYEKRLEKLRMYTEALAEDCEFNESQAKLAEDDAKCNERFVQAQEEKARSIDSLIDEIDSLIDPEATNVRRGK